MRKKLIMLLVAVAAIAAMLMPTIASAGSSYVTADLHVPNPGPCTIEWGAHGGSYAPDVICIDVEIYLYRCYDPDKYPGEWVEQASYTGSFAHAFDVNLTFVNDQVCPYDFKTVAKATYWYSDWTYRVYTDTEGES